MKTQTRYWDNGQKKWEEHYKDDEKDGTWIDWYENGQKKGEGNWTDRERDGLWTKWDKDGNITETKTYKNGKLVQ